MTNLSNRVVLLAVLVTVGCGDGADHGRGLTNLEGADAGAEVADGLPGVKGFVKDETGSPLSDAMVLACMERTCLFGVSDANGRFSFDIDEAVNLALKTLPDLSTVPRRAATLVPVKLNGASVVDVGVVIAPNLPEGAPLGSPDKDPQVLVAGDGIELTVRRADLTAHVGEGLFDLAARLIPKSHRPLLSDLRGEEIIGMYALHPFGAVSRSPMAVRAPSSLPAGTTVNFRTISEIDGRLSAPSPGRADGRIVATDPSVGITELTYLVISR